ncbi:MAG: DNA gyrase inhibitor YacG [Nitrospinae bacterium]|nr:DNA gyrase inhibitor YacG [Nitrospinota bacterium]MBL7019568.1 DNA gyrase inhibitor YacG [Nitrospinaceae bacterium]
MLRLKTVNEPLQKQLKCPICKKPSERDKTKNPFLPFCSDRCRTIDLGKWLDGKYVIEGDESIQDPEL